MIPSLKVDKALVLLTAEWMLVAVLLPISLLVTPARFALFLLVPIGWTLHRMVHGHFVIPTGLDWSLVFLLLMVLVSLFATYDLHLSLPKVAGVLYGITVFYTVSKTAAKSAAALSVVVAILLMMGTGVAILGLVGTNWINKLPVLQDVTRQLPQQIVTLPGAPGGFQPNEVAGTLLWAAPLSTCLAAFGVSRFGQLRRRFRPWFATLLLFFIVLPALIMDSVLLLTQSRAAFLGVSVSAAFVLAVLLSRYRIALTVFLVIAGMLLVAVMSPAGMNTITSVLFDASEESLGSSLSTASLQGRIEIWSRALFAIQHFSFTGLGMNTFREVVHVLYPLFRISPETDITHAHNHLLQTALDLGIPGLTAYLAVWLGTAGMLWNIWHRADLGWLRALALGCAASLLAYFVYGLLDAVALGARPGFIFWSLLGVVAGAHLRIISDDQERPED